MYTIPLLVVVICWGYDMICVILFLVMNISFYAESNIFINDDYNIVLNLTKLIYQSSSYGSEHVFVVLRNRPFFIKLLNYRAKNMWCHFTTSPNYYYTDFETENDAGSINSMVKVPPATEDMNSKWQCTIHRNHPPVDLKISFRIRVKGSYEKRIKIKINENVIRTNFTSSKILEYDEVATYLYRNGETVDLVCSNERYDGQIYLRYYDSKGKMIIKTSELSKSDNNIIFQYKMYNTHNNYVADCTHVTAKERFEFTSRIIFVLNTAPSNSDFKIGINNVELMPYNNYSVTNKVKTSWYSFVYFPEEILTVTCELLQEDNLQLSLLNGKNFKELNKGVGNYEEKRNRFIKFTFRPTSVEQPLICAAYKGTKIKLKAKIFLIKRDQPKLRILGLNAADVFTQYTSTGKDWVIGYVFSAGQVLNVICVTSETGNLRLFESSRMQNYSTKGQNVSKTFVLEDRHHSTQIICRDGQNRTDYKRQVIIKLYLRSSVLDAGTSPTTTLPSGAPEDYSDVAPLDPSDDFNHQSSDGTGMPDSSYNKKVIFGSAVAVSTLALAAFTTLCSVFIYRRHKRARMQMSDENLIQESDTPIPTYPAQWDTRPENGNTGECMVRNSMYDRGNQDENVEYLYVDVEHLKKENNVRPNPIYSTVQYQNPKTLNYSNVNPIRDETTQDKLYDYVYAQ